MCGIRVRRRRDGGKMVSEGGEHEGRESSRLATGTIELEVVSVPRRSGKFFVKIWSLFATPLARRDTRAVWPTAHLLYIVWKLGKSNIISQYQRISYQKKN